MLSDLRKNLSVELAPVGKFIEKWVIRPIAFILMLVVRLAQRIRRLVAPTAEERLLNAGFVRVTGLYGTHYSKPTDAIEVQDAPPSYHGKYYFDGHVAWVITRTGEVLIAGGKTYEQIRKLLYKTCPHGDMRSLPGNWNGIDFKWQDVLYRKDYPYPVTRTLRMARKTAA